MPDYVDGFVIAVPKKKMADYIKTARVAAKVWRDHGAVDYRETVMEDGKAKFGTSFSKLANKKPNETIVFAWIIFKSRKHRDRVNAKVLKDKRMTQLMADMPCPFEMDRMSYGGFETIVK